MADKETEKQREQQEAKSEKAVRAASSKSMMPMIIIIVAVMICAGGGFFSARFLFSPNSVTASGGDGNEPKVEVKAKAKKASGGHGGGGHGGGEAAKTNAPSGPDQSWFFDCDPVVANLDEPGVTRYVRATLIIEMSPEAEYEETNAILEEKKAVMRNWLTIYMAGCTLDDIRGRKNLVRIQAEIKDSLNDMLFKDSKPLISKILFKEFQIQ